MLWINGWHLRHVTQGLGTILTSLEACNTEHRSKAHAAWKML